MMSSDSGAKKIVLDEQTKQRLERLQREDETCDETVERLLNIHGPAVAPEWVPLRDSTDQTSE